MWRPPERRAGSSFFVGLLFVGLLFVGLLFLRGPQRPGLPILRQAKFVIQGLAPGTDKCPRFLDLIRDHRLPPFHTTSGPCAIRVPFEIRRPWGGGDDTLITGSTIDLTGVSVIDDPPGCLDEV